MHVHLLAGLDDGPRTLADALAMCRRAYEDGTRMAAATAHQNHHWRGVTPEGVRGATRLLNAALQDDGLPLSVYPCAEVMVELDTETDWLEGRLLSVADRGQFLLLEMPHGLFVDLRETVRGLRQAGLRPVLAHPERHPEFLEEPGRVEELIRAGCLVQVSSGSVTDPPSRQDRRALKSWFRRGVVHLLGSDGHSPNRRPPLMAAAYREIVSWAGTAVADRICSTNGMAVLNGLPVRTPEPELPAVRWFSRWL
jgi:protein-tyrosine phosphatase